ncbi:PepSY domain-containing protein [Aquimarina sp. Aq107]|uniref:PepSY domain-containing protein n=1 Tax=Aquimarina sp. Aq107 TaxID=1191912 RepID=UPI000D5592D2|nr:PepSY domain-containing protein [Aquimarina sp. Aq107]
MTISLWRYSHLLLAISSAIFLFIASVTGVILALEPISDIAKPYVVDNIKEVTISETIAALREEYDDIIAITVDETNFVIASVVTKEGNDERIYINPRTGEKLGVPKRKSGIFKFATNLHRSLFLKSLGRFFVGLISFLLVVIAITGIILIVKRQGGVLKLFSKVNKEYANQFYHVVLGRWFFVPILIVALTGVYLSIEKFSLLPKYTSPHQINFQGDQNTDIIAITDFSVFKKISLAEVKNIEFPFSDDIEDYFRLELINKELIVNQFNGNVLSEQEYPFVKLATYYALILHTGKGNVLWSFVLLVTSIVILFFMYSGFYMTIKRRNGSKLVCNKGDKDTSDYIILVGSENGSTYTFANYLRKALFSVGKTVFVAELNSYTTYQRAQHIIVITATYGEGEAPTNAKKFNQLFNSIEPINELRFSVVGFGSLAYPEFCKFAEDVDELFREHSKFTASLPIEKINNKSTDDFRYWIQKWSVYEGLTLEIEVFKDFADKEYDVFEVIDRTPLNIDDTFLLRLQSKDSSIDFRSGDLLAIRPDQNTIERLYSIGKVDGGIVLSIKKHDLGLCSSYLSQLNKGDVLKGRIKRNEKFYLPTNTKNAVLIANGTGIAPFLGMIAGENKYVKTHLFWGGRTRESKEIYEDYLKRGRLTKQLYAFQGVYSREDNNEYVQNVIQREYSVIVDVLQKDGLIMICGSVNMQDEVLDVLESIIKNKLNTPLSTFQKNKQIRMDCY